MYHDYIPYQNKLASSSVCLPAHSSHQVPSLLTPLNVQSSLFKPHNYARHVDPLAQYLEFSMYELGDEHIRNHHEGADAVFYAFFRVWWC